MKDKIAITVMYVLTTVAMVYLLPMLAVIFIVSWAVANAYERTTIKDTWKELVIGMWVPLMVETYKELGEL